jgi:hypothetical protein
MYRKACISHHIIRGLCKVSAQVWYNPDGGVGNRSVNWCRQRRVQPLSRELPLVVSFVQELLPLWCKVPTLSEISNCQMFPFLCVAFHLVVLLCVSHKRGTGHQIARSEHARSSLVSSWDSYIKQTKNKLRGLSP